MAPNWNGQRFKSTELSGFVLNGDVRLPYNVTSAQGQFQARQLSQLYFPMPDTIPFVSVIMPIRNEADFISQSLSAVLEQDYPHDKLEVLIADGMSTDDTRVIVGQLAAGSDIPVTLLDNPHNIVPAGLNLTVPKAEGDVIVRVDGHCAIAPDYISRCVVHLQDGEISAVGGPIKTISDTPQGRSIAAAMSSPFGVGDSAFRTVKGKTMLVDTVAFPAYTRTALILAGPFDEELVRNQDDEYNYRLRSLGQKILLAADVRSEYYSRASLGKLWRQYYEYGLYKVRVMQKHPTQMRSRQFVPLLFVLVLFGGLLFSPFLEAIHYLWLATFAAYLAANLVASFLTALQTDWKNLPLLPLVFVTLHLSYGTGFLVGLIKWADRWGDRN